MQKKINEDSVCNTYYSTYYHSLENLNTFFDKFTKFFTVYLKIFTLLVNIFENKFNLEA